MGQEGDIRAASREEARGTGTDGSAYLPQLDGIRAIAIALVLVLHFITPIPFSGEVGVDIFFVLSGYLITSILVAEDRNHGRIRLKRFYARRLVRLYPPLLLAVVVVSLPAMILSPEKAKYFVDTVFAVSYTTPFAISAAPGASVVWRHTWSLGVEEFFYLIWPVLLLGLIRLQRTTRARVATIVGLATILMVSQFLWVDDGRPLQPLLRSGGLFAGCALALVITHRSTVVPAIIGWVGGGLIALAVVLPADPSFAPVSVALAVTGSAALIAHCATSGASFLTRILSKRPLPYIGRASYEIYLWHYPVLVLCTWALGGDFINVAWLAAPLSVTIALLAHALLVAPLRRLKARLPY